MVTGIEATAHCVEPFGHDQYRVTFEIPRCATLYRLVCDAALRRIDERARTSA